LIENTPQESLVPPNSGPVTIEAIPETGVIILRGKKVDVERAAAAIKSIEEKPESKSPPIKTSPTNDDASSSPRR